jgi:hypothetical protein
MFFVSDDAAAMENSVSMQLEMQTASETGTTVFVASDPDAGLEKSVSLQLELWQPVVFTHSVAKLALCSAITVFVLAGISALSSSVSSQHLPAKVSISRWGSKVIETAPGCRITCKVVSLVYPVFSLLSNTVSAARSLTTPELHQVRAEGIPHHGYLSVLK